MNEVLLSSDELIQQFNIQTAQLVKQLERGELILGLTKDLDGSSTSNIFAAQVVDGASGEEKSMMTPWRRVDPSDGQLVLKWSNPDNPMFGFLFGSKRAAGRVYQEELCFTSALELHHLIGVFGVRFENTDDAKKIARVIPKDEVREENPDEQIVLLMYRVPEDYWGDTVIRNMLGRDDWVSQLSCFCQQSVAQVISMHRDVAYGEAQTNSPDHLLRWLEENGFRYLDRLRTKGLDGLHRMIGSVEESGTLHPIDLLTDESVAQFRIIDTTFRNLIKVNSDMLTRRVTDSIRWLHADPKRQNLLRPELVDGSIQVGLTDPAIFFDSENNQMRPWNKRDRMFDVAYMVYSFAEAIALDNTKGIDAGLKFITAMRQWIETQDCFDPADAVAFDLYLLYSGYIATDTSLRMASMYMGVSKYEQANLQMHQAKLALQMTANYIRETELIQDFVE
jgi:hypothetical protein